MTTITPTTPPAGQSLRLVAADGYALGAQRFAAQGELQARLIVAGATGVPQGFYRRFAQHAAGQGFEVLTLDYRGIGRSRPAKMRGFSMDYLDWARLDLAAAVDAMPDDGLPLVMVGHSFGGHAFGLLPNHQRVSRFITLATGAGWHGWMPRGEQLRVLFMWRVLGPLLTRWKGYLPWRMLGMGEDLPLDVYRQWRHWCGFPRYFFDDPAMASHGLAARFAAVRTPTVALNASDDLWAPPASRDAFMAAYTQAPLQRVTLQPSAIGLKSIGHMGYFRSSALPLWNDMLAWLQGSDPAGQTLLAP